MKPIFLFLLLIASGAALAGPDTSVRLSQLRSELSSVQQEQQSVYQEYQMTRELRRDEVQEKLLPMTQPSYDMNISTPPPNYDDVVRAQLERENRIQQYTSDLKRLSMRFLELGNRRKMVLEQLHELEQHPDK